VGSGMVVPGVELAPTDAQQVRVRLPQPSC
jgi:hypothetical protein